MGDADHQPGSPVTHRHRTNCTVGDLGTDRSITHGRRVRHFNHHLPGPPADGLHRLLPTADYVQAVHDTLVAELENSVKFGISAFITDEGIGAGPLAAAVESRGFSSLCVTEHSHIPVAPKEPIPPGGEVPREYHRTMDPFVALALAAAVTRNLGLSTGILLLPQRDVIYTAKEISSLDVVSNGRLNVGVGVGWNRDEMRNHGTAPATRGEKMNEQLAALKQIWTQDEAEFHGQFIDFDPIFSWPKPVQRPHPPDLHRRGEPRSLAPATDAWRRLATAGRHRSREDACGTSVVGGQRPHRRTVHDLGRRERHGHTGPGYADAGVDEVCFLLPTRFPESATLRDLDELTDLVSGLS